jgi:ATP-binding protein involved in chromosome partitioning
MVNKVMTHFFENVEWGYLDYLIIDLPPGTGDASLDLLQTLPIAGTVIVTTPQQMSLDDAKKGLKLFNKHDTPVLGVVENMSSFVCPNCEDVHEVFGSDGAEQICREYDVELIGQVPVHPDFGADGSEGPLIKDEDSPVQEHTETVVTDVLDRLAEVNRRKVAGRTPWKDDRKPTTDDDPAVNTVGGGPNAATPPNRADGDDDGPSA